MSRSPLIPITMLGVVCALGACSTSPSKENQEILSMKSDAGEYNASASKSAIVAAPAAMDETDSQTVSVESGADALSGLSQQEVTVHFAFDSAELSAEARAELDGLVAELPESEVSADMTVNGYTDAIGSDDYNVDLSEARASQVVSYLRDRGVTVSEWFIEGWGEARPVANNDTSAGRAQNRRVVVMLEPMQ